MRFCFLELSLWRISVNCNRLNHKNHKPLGHHPTRICADRSSEAGISLARSYRQVKCQNVSSHAVSLPKGSISTTLPHYTISKNLRKLVMH